MRTINTSNHVSSTGAEVPQEIQVMEDGRAIARHPKGGGKVKTYQASNSSVSVDIRRIAPSLWHLTVTGCGEGRMIEAARLEDCILRLTGAQRAVVAELFAGIWPVRDAAKRAMRRALAREQWERGEVSR